MALFMQQTETDPAHHVLTRTWTAESALMTVDKITAMGAM